jgi:ribosome-associated toxin RatA of RatAB toxin-antitoxin module
MEYEESRRMPAAADVVFDIMSDVATMQHWLPTTMEVEDAGPDRVHVEGEARGHHYATDGLFRAEKEQLRMEWGSEGPDYAGWAQVYHEGDDASEVNLHLSFFGKQPEAHRGAAADQTRETMLDALKRLEDEVTRRTRSDG